MINLRLTGNWIGARNGLASLPLILHSSSMWGQRKAAEKLVKIVKGHINNQDLNWAPLSSSTNSGDPRILVDTQAYLNSIKAWRQNYVYNVGVPLSAYNHRGISISEIATRHEYGFGVPQRPLWIPSVQELGGPKGVAKIVSRAIFNKILKLRSQGFKVKWGL